MTGPGLGSRSPLDGVALPAGVREIPFLGQLDLRADPADAALLDRLEVAIGVAPPTVPNTIATTADGARQVAWLGPDEWLILGAAGTAPGLETALRSAMGRAPGAVVDVSANRTTIEIDGPHARELLEHGCSIDLHPRVFGPGDCAQTNLARANIVLLQVSDRPTYRILVRPSFAAYLAAWLVDAAGGIANKGSDGA